MELNLWHCQLKIDGCLRDRWSTGAGWTLLSSLRALLCLHKNHHQIPVCSMNVVVTLHSLKLGFNPCAGSGSTGTGDSETWPWRWAAGEGPVQVQVQVRAAFRWLWFAAAVGASWEQTLHLNCLFVQRERLLCRAGAGGLNKSAPKYEIETPFVCVHNSYGLKHPSKGFAFESPCLKPALRQ